MAKYIPVFDKSQNPPILVNCLDELGNPVDVSNCQQVSKEKNLQYQRFCVVLADGSKVERFLAECIDCTGNEWEDEFWTDEIGNRIDAPDLTDAVSCGCCPDVEKDPICFEFDGVYHKGWEIETIDPQTGDTLTIKAVNRERTIEADVYTIIDCDSIPAAPLAIDDAGFQIVTGQAENITVSFNDTPCLAPDVTSYILIPGSEVNAVVTPSVMDTGAFGVTAIIDGPWSFGYEILCNGAYTGETAQVSGTAVTVCTVGVANATYDPFTCTLSVTGSGATNIEFSIDGGTTWFGDGDTDYEFLDCFVSGTVVDILVRDGDDIACQSPVPFQITPEGNPMLYIGKKNDLAGGLNEDKEQGELISLINGGYDVHYVNVGDVKNDYTTLSDMLDEHPCVKFIYVTGEAKDVKDVPLFLTWDIPIILGGNKDLYKELDIGDKDGHESDPKDTFVVEINTDPTGVLNTYTVGDNVVFSGEGKKTVWVDTTGTDIVNLGSVDGEDTEAAVWYVAPGGIYNEDGATTTNYVFGMPWHKDSAKDLNAAAQTLIQEAAAFSFTNGNQCP